MKQIFWSAGRSVLRVECFNGLCYGSRLLWVIHGECGDQIFRFKDAVLMMTY